MGKILSETSDKNNTLAGAISDRAQAGFVPDGGKGSHRLDRHPDDRKMVTPRARQRHQARLCPSKSQSAKNMKTKYLMKIYWSDDDDALHGEPYPHFLGISRISVPRWHESCYKFSRK